MFMYLCLHLYYVFWYVCILMYSGIECTYVFICACSLFSFMDLCICLTYRAMKVLLQMSLKENTLVNYILISYGVSEAFSLK